MKFITPDTKELSLLRADPLINEQELDLRQGVAEALEKAVGKRAGRVYWRSEHDYLYALELADLGQGYPSQATVYGFWERYEPRPPEHEIDADLLDFLLWFAGISGSISPADVMRTVEFAQKQTGRVKTTWPEGSVLHTPEERFADLPGFLYPPRYTKVDGLRMAYIEQGAGDPILMLHGEPTWGYLYRKMVPVLVESGRVIVPDMIGFGRSDKPAAANAYSYRSAVRWMQKFILALDLKRITLVAQDWGGLIGLRMVAQSPERFHRLVLMNTGIPYGQGAGQSEAFMKWRRYTQRQRTLDVAAVLKDMGRCSLGEKEAAAYNAPFPSRDYQTAALVFPRLVPVRPDHPGSYNNYMAVQELKKLDIPVLLPWSDSDLITRDGEGVLRGIFKSCAPPLTIKGAGHFIQEDAGEKVAGYIRDWLKTLPGS